MTRVLVFLLCFTVAMPVHADWLQDLGHESPPDALFGEDRLVYVHSGTPVPFDGVLMDTTTAARWSLREDWYKSHLTLDTDALRLAMDTQLKGAAAIQDSQKASYEREVSGLRGDLRNQAKAFQLAKDPPFYKKPAFAFCMGVVLGIVVPAVGAATAMRLRK